MWFYRISKNMQECPLVICNYQINLMHIFSYLNLHLTLYLHIIHNIPCYFNQTTSKYFVSHKPKSPWPKPSQLCPYITFLNELAKKLGRQLQYTKPILQLIYFTGTRMKNDICCVFEGIDNNGAIYISGIHAAQSLDILKDRKINAVLSVARGGKLSHSNEHIKHYLYIPAEDHEQYDISKFFSNAFEFIEKARKETNVLIHCMAGISRSATITAAYLMMKFGYQMNTVLSLLQRKRKQIKPNPSFLRQLSEISSGVRTVSKSVDQRRKEGENRNTLCLPSTKEISCSLKKQSQNQLITSKYLSSYNIDKTPTRAKNASGVLQPKNSNRRQKIQSKIQRVKKSLFFDRLLSNQSENTEIDKLPFNL